MTLADQYYVDFMLNNKISKSNRILLDEALTCRDSLEISKVQLLEAMLISKVYPTVEIGITNAAGVINETVRITKEDVVFLLNSYVCKTEFFPKTQSKYEAYQHLKVEVALETLIRQFKIYIEHGQTRNKQTLPMKS